MVLGKAVSKLLNYDTNKLLSFPIAYAISKKPYNLNGYRVLLCHFMQISSKLYNCLYDKKGKREPSPSNIVYTYFTCTPPIEFDH